MTDLDPFEQAVATHDAALAALGLDIWVGNEPTFTDPGSHAAEWVTAALGTEKRGRAERIVARLANERRGCAVVRSIGRQYPNEAGPRWCFGLYARRDGTEVWSGPRDPLLAGPSAPADLDELHVKLDAALARHGDARRLFSAQAERRIVFALDPDAILPDPSSDARLLRPSVHIAGSARSDPLDDLAGDGLFLLIVSDVEERGGSVPCVELPAVDDVALFLRILAAISEAADKCGLPSLILRGYAPPVDATVSWATVTPDPAVVEINMAPHGSVLSFLRDNRRCYSAAAAAGLAPHRLQYNGAVADSGGGGQITFGGPSPVQSPFFLEPRLLPGLIRYAGRHPALSYLFAHDYVGASGQSVRPDEHGADALVELRLALALLNRSGPHDARTLWLSLAPSLTDPVGNSHRAEINIEKLWNPHQPGRGQQGLVEFRAFRMQHTPERAAALAALLRGILAMLMKGGHGEDLIDWGSALHDRFALPFYLEADLRDVLQDLDAAGVGLAPALRVELERDDGRLWTTIEFGGSALSIRRALEFWPLLGDASNQLGTSRLIDASISRIELALRPRTTADAETLGAWRLRANDYDLPLRNESDARGPVRVFGVRYRSFVPTTGLHPLLSAQQPVRLVLMQSEQDKALEVVLHEWRPDGAAYEGVPGTLEEAASRRAARCVVRRVPVSEVPAARQMPPGALNACSLDLRFASALSPLRERWTVDSTGRHR